MSRYALSPRLPVDLGPTTAADRLSVVGNLNLAGTLTVTADAGFGPGTYDVVSYSGTLLSDALQVGSAPAGYTYQLSTATPGEVDLIIATAAAPEPTSAALVAPVVAAVWCRRRRRR